MFSKRFFSGFCVAAFVFGLVGATLAVRDDITLLMVPQNDETAVKLGRDVAKQHPATLLIRYMATPQGVSIHGFNGAKWVNITHQDFVAGKFFREGPTSALLIESPDMPLVAALVPPAEWCPNVGKITTTDPRVMLHLVGRYYDIKYKEWELLAKDYNYTLEEINPEGLNVRWYHRRMSDNIAALNQVVADDLQYWTVLRKEVIVEPVVAPVVEETVVETPVEETAPVVEETQTETATEETSGDDAATADPDTPAKADDATPEAKDVFAEEVTPAIVVGGDKKKAE